MRKLLLSAIVLSAITLLAGCAGALHSAAAKGDLATMKALLDGSAGKAEHDGDFSNLIDGWSQLGWGGPPLHHAAYFCRVDAVRLLIERGADVNSKGGKGLTALHRAIAKDCVDVVKVLVESGAEVNAYDEWKHSPLSWAALLRSYKSAKLLIEKGADVREAIMVLENPSAKVGKDKTDYLAGVYFLRTYTEQAETKTQSVAARQDRRGIDKSVPKSDIDELPPIKTKPNANAYAIVIGIEEYRQGLPKADFASNDARLMSEYLTKVMGYPEENVVTLINDRALKSDMEKYFEKWLSNNVEKGGTVFVYYSGHGAPNTKTGDAYIVPYDGDPSFIEETGFSLKRLYSSLEKLDAKEITVALDSCFSGAGGRSVIAKGSRPLVMNTAKTAPVSGKLTVLSAAGGDQTSSTYDEKGHGLFTYFMLKGLKGAGDSDGDGSIDAEELYSYLKPQVERIARKLYNNEQSPLMDAPQGGQRLVLVEAGR